MTPVAPPEGVAVDAFMRDSDAFSWYMEQDPILRSTVVAVAWLECSPDWDVLVAKLDRATRMIPMFRQRVIEPPARLATPRWTVDGSFDLTWHLRRVDSPEPHMPSTVITMARIAAMTSFDRSRPLWEFTLVEHLEGNRAALIMKVHHSLTDGLGGMQLALLLFDVDPVVTAPDDQACGPAAEHIGTGELLRLSLNRDWDRLAGVMHHGAEVAAPGILRAARHPVASVGRIVETALSIGRTVAPVRTTLSPIMTERGLDRRLDILEVDLGDLKRAADTAGGTVNDGFMAAVAGGFRLYHEHHGVVVEALRVTLPISIRTPEDPLGGNRITLIRFCVPVSDPDPASRIGAMNRLCRTARDERSLPMTNTIAGALNLLPRGTVGRMLKHVDFVASDVPGFTFPVHLAGARLERYVAFGPTIGSSANLTLLSYNGTCCVGVTIDTAAVPDAVVLADCLRAGFEEVLALGGEHDPVRTPLRVAARATGPRSET
ncbi:MAG TPA: wax ester/triacylglycerol synthase domain-containing protein [Acidimicrobiales bacterium]|nr:wax ester/triacylglycerol synthase domain-containing protein [Acidimicrobiales bacterium]